MQNSYLCKTKDMYHNAYRNIHRRQKLEKFHIYVNSKMEKLILVYLDRGILCIPL